MSDTDNADLPGEVLGAHNPGVIPVAIGTTVWARARNGIVEEVRAVMAAIERPFGDTEDRVINVTAVPCAPGYVMDTAGNVAPPASQTLTGDAPYLPGPGAAPILGKEPVPDAAVNALPDDPSEAAQAQHDIAVEDAKADGEAHHD